MTTQGAAIEGKEFIKDLQEGNSEAWKRLWNEEAWKIIALARRRGLDEDSAREICQEVFEKLVHRLRSPLDLGPGGLRLFIYKIVRYEITEFLHRQEKQVLLSVDDLTYDASLIDLIASPELGLEEKSLQNERVKVIRKAMEKLTPAEHKVILFALEGFTSSEIAKLSGRSQVTVEKQRHRALKKMRTILAEAPGE